MSPEREARILIVDDQRDIARVLRTALELSERGYFVVDVPSGEEALLELGRVEFDVVVADYRLPGMSGPELLARICKRKPGVKSILITGNPLDEVRHELRAKNIEAFRIFEKPIDTQAFTEAVHIAIHGEAEAEVRRPAEGKLGAIPEFDEVFVSRELSSLRSELGARGVAFINRSGKILIRDGAVDDVPRFGELAVLLANNFTTTAEIAGYLGEEPSTAVHYYDGSWFDIYALSVGVHFFIVIVFPGGSQKQMGPVLRYGKSAARKMSERIGEALEPARPPLPKAAPVEVAAQPAEKEVAEEVPAVWAEPAEVPMTVPVGEAGEAGQLDLDLESLDLELDAEIGDLGKFWEEAASAATRISDDALSLDEAVELGLIPKDTDLE